MSTPKIQFNRNELAGAFGDIGTDLPLLVAMIIAAGLHVPSVLIVFGVLQIITGLVYRMPMPVQPLKAMAAIVIAQDIGGPVLLGAGLSIGVLMLILSLTGTLDLLAKYIPKAVIRGIQMGLGISLMLLAFKKYIPGDGMEGYVVAAIAFVVAIALIDSKRYPAAIVLVVAGAAYAFMFDASPGIIVKSVGIHLPQFHVPAIEDITKGFLLLALPQIPLSLGNSIVATRQVSSDLFPERKPLSIKKIGLTYAAMNLVAPFISGVPCCHGSGGMVGHYTFGGRTGASVVIYGLLFIGIGLFFSNGFEEVIKIFPLSVLGVILVFEGLALMILVRDQMSSGRNTAIAMLTAVIAAGLPYGFVLALFLGSALYYSPLKLSTFSNLFQKDKRDDSENEGA